MAGLFLFLHRKDDGLTGSNQQRPCEEDFIKRRTMIRRIVAGVILALLMVAAAAMVAQASKLHPQAQIGVMDSAGD